MTVETTGIQALAMPLARLSWEGRDIERKFWFPGSQQTNVNSALALLLGLPLTAAYYALLLSLPPTRFSTIWLELGWVPYVIATTFFWGLAFLLLKWRKLALQRQALNVRIVPDDYGFVLSPQSTELVRESLYRQVQDPERFTLFNRILRAISNLKNLGRVDEVQALLRAQSDMDHNAMESSYTVLRGLAWAMPVLGFIGTVNGLSIAIGGFGSVLAAGGDMAALRESLHGVVGGLSVAFGTTFEGLLCTLVLQMVLSFSRKAEENFQEACDSYCYRNILSKLRLCGPEEKH